MNSFRRNQAQWFADKWQSIDEAPHDGTHILCWEEGKFYVAQWFPAEKIWVSFLPDGAEAAFLSPSKWQPLPAAPIGTKQNPVIGYNTEDEPEWLRGQKILHQLTIETAAGNGLILCALRTDGLSESEIADRMERRRKILNDLQAEFVEVDGMPQFVSV